MPKSTPERDRAKQVRDGYHASLERLRADPNLTEEARVRKIAELHTSTRGQLGRLSELDGLRLDDAMKQVDRTIFSGVRSHWGDGPEVHQAIRAAQDRAQSAQSPDELHQMLDQAELSGDHAMSSAVAAVADRRAADAMTPGQHDGWSSVYQKYMDARPHLMDAQAESDSIHQLRADASHPLAGPFSPPVRPPEARQHERNARAEAAAQADSGPSALTRG